MKKIIILQAFIFLAITLAGQSGKIEILTNLEKDQQQVKSASGSARIKAATRLFKEKDDLTSVITIISEGEEVNILDGDSTYLHVTYGDDTGFIFRKHAVIYRNSQSDLTERKVVSEPAASLNRPDEQVADPVNDRYEYLADKYGREVAGRIMQGKIWKGMNPSMVRDSWGNPFKITKSITSSITSEEWSYRNSWLRFENNVLVQWGPVGQ